MIILKEDRMHPVVKHYQIFDVCEMYNIGQFALRCSLYRHIPNYRDTASFDTGLINPIIRSAKNLQYKLDHDYHFVILKDLKDNTIIGCEHMTNKEISDLQESIKQFGFKWAITFDDNNPLQLLILYNNYVCDKLFEGGKSTSINDVVGHAYGGSTKKEKKKNNSDRLTYTQDL